MLTILAEKSPDSTEELQKIIQQCINGTSNCKHAFVVVGSDSDDENKHCIQTIVHQVFKCLPHQLLPDVRLTKIGIDKVDGVNSVELVVNHELENAKSIGEQNVLSFNIHMCII